MTFALQPLRPESRDYEAFIVALQDAVLRTDDLNDGGRYFALSDGDELVGFGGLDGSGQDQMIRSIATVPGARGRGYGKAVVRLLTERARAEGVERLWLLTTSADRFFAGLGWNATDRAVAPAAVRQSRQFSGLCPSSAVLMCRRLA